MKMGKKQESPQGKKLFSSQFLFLVVSSIFLLFQFVLIASQWHLVPKNASYAASSNNRGGSIFNTFEKAARKIYVDNICTTNSNRRSGSEFVTPSFNLNSWDQTTQGGLEDKDRIMLAKYYGGANSVFEWGLGESTSMAGFLNVPRYAGVDSDAEYVGSSRDKSPKRFRFSFADVGKTIAHRYGRPEENLPKNQYNYVIAPLLSELCPFDVYMVDGRYRAACALMALLHSSRYAMKENNYNNHDATILMHDYQVGVNIRGGYKQVEKVCDIVEHSGGKLIALKRKVNVTEEEIYQLYLTVKDDIH